MEGPTPVSSLLHSSTMVVAGVFLWIMVGYKRFLIIVIIFSVLLVLRVIFYFDLKKNIAFSTSSNLAIIFLISCCRIYSLVCVHIIVHAYVKASVFMESGVMIHCSGSQDLRCIYPSNLGIWLLVGVTVYILSKELFVLEVGIVGYVLFMGC